ncbi:hypothetical protein CVT26_015427 [Gymnopilus dilepis]|uniref:Uncharacterized protein n=1 Tax=Gymnopilus dilepis TaxID=231916 RepID=A0A409YEK3_9AGAR|nr:hypothetical protein CVT26_015427 [Gymnopilus dilepis]
MFCDRKLVIEAARANPGTPLCTRCWSPSALVALALIPRTSIISLPDENIEQFLSDIADSIKAINVAMLEPTTPDQVDALAKAIATAFHGAWEEHTREVFNTNRSKPWWNAECKAAILKYRESGSSSDFNAFRKVCRKTKRIFFDACIHEIASTNKRPWDLMNWIQQRKLPPAEAITYNGRPCHDMGDLWDALHNTYNAGSNRTYDVSCLDELEDTPVRDWF